MHGTFPLDEFLRHLLAQDRAERTIREYQADLAVFVTWFEGIHGQPPIPTAITPLDIRQWKAWMDDRGWMPATINRRLAALRAYFRWAHDHGVSVSNPSRGIRDKRRRRDAPKALTRSQVRKLRHAAEARIVLADARRRPTDMTATAREARRDRAILLTFLGTGLRVSELCAIRLQDMSLKPRNGDVTVRAGKGDRWRTMPLNADVRQTLHHWLNVRPSVTTDWVFVGRRGEQLRPRGMQRIIDRLASHAGLPIGEVTAHRLRHTFAKSLIDVGAPLTNVQALLGHHSIVTTTRYTMPHPDDLAAAVERISWEDSD